MGNDKFVPADPRCKQCYYWRTLSGYNTGSRACHYALDTGELRKKISKTKCGSFVDATSKEPPKRGFYDVPITQWGCPEIVDWESQR